MKWVPEQSTQDLPERIRTHFVYEAERLLTDLKNHQQQVVLQLLDAPYTHQNQKARVETCGNPEWYSNFHQTRPHFRKNWSKKALTRIVNGLDKKIDIPNTRYTFDTLYRGFILERLTEGYTENMVPIPPIKEVKKYFETENGYILVKRPVFKTSRKKADTPF